MSKFLFERLGTIVITLRYVKVPLFNLGKYVIMAYFIGLLWDFAYLATLETKRYLSLHYTGGFSVSRWGHSRNNLFSGSNFELFFRCISLSISREGLSC